MSKKKKHAFFGKRNMHRVISQRNKHRKNLTGRNRQNFALFLRDKWIGARMAGLWHFSA